MSDFITSVYRIKRGSENYRASLRACQIVRRIKNQTLYLIKNELKENGKPFSHSDADKWLKANNRSLYDKLPAAVAQRATQVVGESVNGFFKSLAEFQKNPGKFKGRPRFPSYGNEASAVVIGRNGFAVKGNQLILPKALGFEPVQLHFSIEQPFNEKQGRVQVNEVKIVPRGSCFEVHVVHRSWLTAKNNSSILLNKSRASGIDIGINNLMTLVTNQPGIAPVLIKGTVLKSVNAKYNKDASELRSLKKGAHLKGKSEKRRRVLKDYLHKVSRKVVNYCLEHDIGTLVIGKNKDFKQEINIGAVNNQKFTFIPHALLIQMLISKAQRYGIAVAVREESYTSKASSLDFDALPTYGEENKVKPLFSGRRVKRGLYKCKSGLLNADVNGALNILRKELGDAALQLVDRGRVYRPEVWNCHNQTNPKVYGNQTSKRMGVKQLLAA